MLLNTNLIKHHPCLIIAVVAIIIPLWCLLLGKMTKQKVETQFLADSSATYWQTRILKVLAAVWQNYQNIGRG